jgi:methyltransferase FkbM-like protein
VFAAATASVSGFQHFRMSSTNRLVNEPTDFVVRAIMIDPEYEAMRWDAIDLIKMDVEGIEAELLTKAGNALRRARFVIFELHSWIDGEAVKQGLRDLGFAVHHVNQTGEQVYLGVNQRLVAH